MTESGTLATEIELGQGVRVLKKLNTEFASNFKTSHFPFFKWKLGLASMKRVPINLNTQSNYEQFQNFFFFLEIDSYLKCDNHSLLVQHWKDTLVTNTYIQGIQECRVYISVPLVSLPLWQ